MTRFEASVIMFMVMAIMLILLFGVISIISILNDIKQQHDNILDELRTMNSQSICWNELTDSQKSEILYRLTHTVVESPFKPPFNPTCETTNKVD